MLVIAAYERPPRRLADQGGMAVVVALLVLALLSLLGITLMGLSVTESQIGSNEADLKKAFFAAEAGIQEAMYRMRLPITVTNESTACSGTADPVVIGKQGSPDVTWPDPTSGNFWYYNPVASQTPCPSWSYIAGPDTDPPIPPGNYFGGRAGNLDTAGRTFKFCAWGDMSVYCTSENYVHRSGNALFNSNLNNKLLDPRSYEVKVRPVVGFIGGCWQYVNPYKEGAGNPVPLDGSSCTPPKLPSPFNPFFKVTSTGTAKTSSKVLSTMIQRFNVNPKPDAPLTANSDVEVTSASAIIDGHNWNCAEPPTLVGDGDKWAVAAPPIGDPPVPDIDTNKPENLVCEFGSGIGVGDCGRLREAFPETIGELLLGHPYRTETTSKERLQQIKDFNAYLESIKKTPGVDTYPENVGDPFNGILYVDGNYTQPPDLSSGILIVHNSTNTANLGNWNGGTFKGVVIADGINKINGNVTIIGAVYGWGTASTIEVDITAGTPQIKYSKCVLDGLNQNFPYLTVKGTWHEE